MQPPLSLEVLLPTGRGCLWSQKSSCSTSVLQPTCWGAGGRQPAALGFPAHTTQAQMSPLPDTYGFSLFHRVNAFVSQVVLSSGSAAASSALLAAGTAWRAELRPHKPYSSVSAPRAPRLPRLPQGEQDPPGTLGPGRGGPGSPVLETQRISAPAQHRACRLRGSRHTSEQSSRLSV